MATASKIIRGAMSDLSILAAGQAPKGDVLTRMLELLNRMLDTWRRNHLLAYVNTETVATLNGDTLAIGPGQALNTANPSRIELGSFTRYEAIDAPLYVLDDAEFNAIALKGTSESRPYGVNLVRGVGTSVCRFWPQGQCEVHILTRQLLLQFADLTTDYPLAPGYEDAITSNLAVRAQATLNVAAAQHVLDLAASSLKGLEDDSVTVPQLDVGLSGAAGPGSPEWGTLFGYGS